MPCALHVYPSFADQSNVGLGSYAVREIEVSESAKRAPNETVLHIAGICEVARDGAEAIDAVCESHGASWRVEWSDCALHIPHETMQHVARIGEDACDGTGVVDT